jgi:hypothetical protein
MKFKRAQAKERIDMGLDMYAYTAARAGQQREFYESAVIDVPSGDLESTTVTQPREIAYWRKHPNLHGWMEQLWNKRNGGNQDGGNFNGIELELTYEDLEILEQDVIAGTLPGTTGFFFGNDADDHYRDQDLEFIRNARAELFMGLKVFYNSSW